MIWRVMNFSSIVKPKNHTKMKNEIVLVTPTNINLTNPSCNNKKGIKENPTIKTIVIKLGIITFLKYKLMDKSQIFFVKYKVNIPPKIAYPMKTIYNA